MARKSKTPLRARRESPAAEISPPPAPVRAAAGPFGQIGLNVLVFIAGAVLMGLEIAGSRVLAPHFGNSVFVWGSLISVFLIALSLGYYIGGRLADRRPSRLLLNSICAGVSLLIFAVSLGAYPFCEALVEMGLGEESGPLLASTVLFLPASLGMGMVSPFAVRLAAQSVSSMGKIAGTLYALSTAGSIAGTLITTFVLIPLIGSSAILKGLSLTLLLTAVLTLPLGKRLAKIAGWTAVAVLTAGSLLWAAPRESLRLSDELLVDADTPYHHVSVIDNRKDGTRQLRFDQYEESEIRTAPPYSSPNSYTNYFHLAFLAEPVIERTLFIGAGGGIGPRAFHLHNPAMAIDVVDIDPKVLQLAYDYFHLDRSPRIRTVAEDGRMFLRKSRTQYDCVVLDAFSIGGRIPFHLVTREFLELCRRRMSENGVFVMNINSAIQGPMARIYQSMVRTVAAVFPRTYVFAKDHRYWGLDHSMNVILLATVSAHRMTADEWSTRARLHQSNSYIKKEQLVAMADDLLPDTPTTASAPMFTDDYSPIETMPF